MKHYQIIPMTEEYIEQYAATLDSVCRERIYLGTLEAPALESVQSFIMKALNDDWVYYIAILNGRVLGWCNIGKMNRPLFDHVGELGIGVVADFRGQGIGEALIRAALIKAKENGLKRVTLSVREPNKRAISLYEKVGFVREGLHRKAVCLDGVYEDEVLMGLLYEQL